MTGYWIYDFMLQKEFQVLWKLAVLIPGNVIANIIIDSTNQCHTVHGPSLDSGFSFYKNWLEAHLVFLFRTLGRLHFAIQIQEFIYNINEQSRIDVCFLSLEL